MVEDQLEDISAHPVKSFFVHMLTRDILLTDAILDLLDNCVDGIQRTATQKKLSRKKPYEGYWAKISISSNKFIIEDNCGGIPWDIHKYAFRMGSIKRDTIKGRKSVGTYGIGMKRAIFKIGQDCLVVSNAADRSYRVHFTPEWMADEENWELRPLRIRSSQVHGTKIEITQINSTIRSEFNSENFLNSFKEAVSSHYAYIIDKGFEVTVNNKTIEPKAIKLVYSKVEDPVTKGLIRPFIYEAKHNGVEIFLAVGFTSDIPSKEEVDNGLENYRERYSSEQAGWTVICNDRTIVYCDKSALTGWGVSGVPQYHTQFIAISGIVLFSSDKPELLPTTTTKRGIDASSQIYLHVRDKMIEGMKIFTQYTNQWKTKELVKASRESFRKAETFDLEKVKNTASKLKMTPTRGVIKGTQYKPSLPLPKIVKTHERISYVRPVKDIYKVSAYLFDKKSVKANAVGEKCFDLILEEATE